MSGFKVCDNVEDKAGGVKDNIRISIISVNLNQQRDLISLQKANETTVEITDVKLLAVSLQDKVDFIPII